MSFTFTAARTPARLLAAASLALAFATAPAALRQEASPESLWTVEGISEYRLDNGLRFLLFPDPSKDKFTVNVTVMVGSRHEGRGEKGMAHLLEHMVFKGTDTFENIWGALEDHGANFNGTTWVDRTNYFETLPASDENLEFALSMEADRLVNSRIAAEELAKEMTVVRNEFERGENNPIGVLMQRITSSAFLWHNYGKSTIGNRSDIERVPADNLRNFYELYYQPDNVLLVVAGKFDEARTIELIEEHFGSIPRPTRVLESTWTEEPIQDGSRFVTLKRVGSNQAAGAAYHVAAGSHPDAPALQVLARILTAPPSGRVYEALVPEGLAAGTFAFAQGTAEPGLFLVFAQCGEDQDAMLAHDRLIEVVEDVAATGISEEEVERAKTNLLKGVKLSLQDSGRIGVQLSEWQALGDWRMFFVNRDRLKEVQVADVMRVATQYFVASNRTSGVFLPDAKPVRAEIPATPDVAGLVEGYEGTETIAAGEVFDPTPVNVEARTRRFDLECGLTAAFLPKEMRGDAVVARVALHFGTAEEMKSVKTALDMLPGLLMRGTARLDYQALRDEIDRLQSQVGVFGGAGSIGVSITSDRANLPAALRLAGEILRQPAFPEDQFEIMKRQQIAGLEAQLTDPQPLLFNQLTRSLNPFTKDEFHYVPTLQEELALIQGVTLDSLKDAYGRFYGASYGEVAIVGDFDPDELRVVLNDVFGNWESQSAYEKIIRPFRPIEASSDVILTPDKSNAVVARGAVIQLRDDDPRFAALDFANYILGQSAKSRLLTALRHEGGLSYGAGSGLQVSADEDAGALIGYAICAPENAAEAQRLMKSEFDKWIDKGVSEVELAEGKAGYTKKFDNQMTSDGFVAGALLQGLEIGRTFQYHEALMKSVEGLTLEQISGVLEGVLAEANFVDLKAGDLPLE